MKFVPVNAIPGVRIRPRHRMQGLLVEFIHMEVKSVKVEWTTMEYKDNVACYKSFHTAIKRYGMPVRVVMYNKEVYLERTDI